MKKLGIVAVMLVLAASLGAGLLPGTSLAQEPPTCVTIYVVQAGDWLSKIAGGYLGDVLAYDQIVAANNADPNDAYPDIQNPDLIEPGLQLCIPEGAVAAPAGLKVRDLANATYLTEWTPTGTVTLSQGVFSEPAAPGSASMLTIRLTRHLDWGQLNAQDAAAVVLVSDGGGSGTFYELHAVVAPDGQTTDVAWTLLGDRVQINSVAIENNEIVVDMVEAGPNDPLCCPTQAVVKHYTLQGDQLVETSSQ